MADVVIKVEDLSKRYSLTHRADGAKNYVALRDVLTEKVKRLFSHANQNNATQEDFWALKNISFEISQGDRVGIIGRNGAGKSTLLKVLSRITEPTRGRIVLRGRVASLLEVGTGFHPELTGRENIYLNGAILGMGKAEIKRKFSEIVDFSEIEKFLDTPVKHYSSGMYVRLAFAVAAHLEPEILIVDEVLAVGDAQFQKKCLGKMNEVGNSGRTVLFVSHNLNAIEQLCTRCMLIEHGELKLDSSDVKKVVKSYVMEASGGSKPVEWKNENNSFENPWFKPTWFGICDENGKKIGGPVRNNVDLFVRVEGEVTKYNEKLAIAYYVYNDENVLLYQSATHDNCEDRFPKFKVGFNVLTGELPCRMFNEGEYRIELVVFLHGERYIIQQMQNAPSIFLEIHGEFTHSPRWTTKRAGILAPVLEWRIW